MERLAFSVGIENTGGMQGSSGSDRELLDAAALVGHLVPAGSVYGFLAEHRQRRGGGEQHFLAGAVRDRDGIQVGDGHGRRDAGRS